MLFLCWKIVSINDGCGGTSLFFFERCYGLDVSSSIQMLKLNHQLIVLEGGAFKRWWSHEVGVVVDESSALIKGLEGMSSFSSALLPCKDTVFLFFFFFFCLLSLPPCEDAWKAPSMRNEPLPDTEPAGTLILDFPEYISVLYKLSSLRYFVVPAKMDQD